MSHAAARHAGPGRRHDLAGRAQGALPVLVLYFAFAALYAWQASRHPVPTIFTDELELTQLSRAIAETGEPARRGEPYPASLVAYLLAPVWWLGSAADGYAAAKLVLVLAMTATIFPAYGLARLVVPRWPALAAAAAATAAPALAYSAILVEEPVAYPLSTATLWLTARFVARPSRLGLTGALAAAGVATLTRTQLAVLFAVLALALAWLGWDSEPVRRWRRGWTTWDWVGAATLALGAVLLFSAAMGHASTAWRNSTYVYKERIFDHASWALGALAVGIGIVPLVLGVAALARPRGERADPRTRAFVVVCVSALAAFVWYAGIKGAYVSTVFATYVYERNVIYLAPVLFAATALALWRGPGRLWALALAGAAALYVVNAVPVVLQHPYYEAHGLSILAFANRELGWSQETIDGALVALSAGALALGLLLVLLRRAPAAFSGVAAALAVAIAGWTLTAEVYAAEGERTLSRQVARNAAQPFDWVERATGGAPVVVLGQQIADATGIWLTEFFNPSVRKIWSLDGTAINAGSPILTPDLDATDGTLTPDPDAAFALGVNGVSLQAPVVERRAPMVLYRLDGRPLKLREAVIGRQTDGWIVGTREEPDVARAAYTRYAVAGDGPGFALVRASLVDWCPSPRFRHTATVTARIGPVGIGPDKQPALARVTAERTFRVGDCRANGVLLAPPPGPWRVEVEVRPTFSPRDIDPRSSEGRRLGVVLDVRFQPLLGAGEGG
ncbi:MAG TPA: glycosyltransferase family 39 protein [Gaiellaceae bacterium]|nr:glycosyltransferase family 39 protein [Gaiellaceae bacterium]